MRAFILLLIVLFPFRSKCQVQPPPEKVVAPAKFKSLKTESNKPHQKKNTTSKNEPQKILKRKNILQLREINWQAKVDSFIRITKSTTAQIHNPNENPEVEKLKKELTSITDNSLQDYDEFCFKLSRLISLDPLKGFQIASASQSQIYLPKCKSNKINNKMLMIIKSAKNKEKVIALFEEIDKSLTIEQADQIIVENRASYFDKLVTLKSNSKVRNSFYDEKLISAGSEFATSYSNKPQDLKTLFAPKHIYIIIVSGIETNMISKSNSSKFISVLLDAMKEKNINGMKMLKDLKFFHVTSFMKYCAATGRINEFMRTIPESDDQQLVVNEYFSHN